MDIADASVFFDDDPATDGYSGAALFSGQVASFDDSSSDGATNRRRVLSVGPNVVMPTRKVITLYGDRWLVGIGTPDGFQGQTVRYHYSMKRTTDLVAVLTPIQALAAAAGTPAYVHKNYYKEMGTAITNAELDTYWSVFIAPGEAADRGTFLRASNGLLYRARNEYLPVEGLRVLQCDQLEDAARTTATFNVGTIDPITEVRGGGTSIVNVIQVETSKFYRFRHGSDPQVAKGDIAVFVPFAPKQNDTFVMGAVRWRVLTVQAELDAWVVHARLA